MQTLKPHERRHLRTKQAILDAARKLLAEKGVNGVSLRGIAREIDYSPAGLYEYFDSKEDIVRAVCQEGHLKLAAEMGRVDDDLPYPEYLRGIGQAYQSFARSNPDHFMLMFTIAPKGNQLDDFMDEGSSFPILMSAIQRGIDEGYFKMHPAGISAMAMILWSSVHGLAMLEHTQLKGSDIDFKVMGEIIGANTFMGLTAGPPSPLE
ncbi:MAG: TetR/AcrR family transcriptional regulator [Chloroflexota bacterium]